MKAWAGIFIWCRRYHHLMWIDIFAFGLCPIFILYICIPYAYARLSEAFLFSRNFLSSVITAAAAAGDAVASPIHLSSCSPRSFYISLVCVCVFSFARSGCGHHAVVGPQPDPPVRQVRAVHQGQAGDIPPRRRVQHVPPVHVPPPPFPVSSGKIIANWTCSGNPGYSIEYFRLGPLLPSSGGFCPFLAHPIRAFVWSSVKTQEYSALALQECGPWSDNHGGMHPVWNKGDGMCTYVPPHWCRSIAQLENVLDLWISSHSHTGWWTEPSNQLGLRNFFFCFLHLPSTALAFSNNFTAREGLRTNV